MKEKIDFFLKFNLKCIELNKMHCVAYNVLNNSGRIKFLN